MTSLTRSSLWNQLFPRKSQNASLARRRLFLEPLESRQLLASDVLLLYDTLQEQTPALIGALEDAGNTVTTASTSTFTGANPPLDSFDAVIHLDDQLLDPGVSSTGAQALVEYVKSGGGYIHTGWVAVDEELFTPALREIDLFDVYGINPSTTVRYTAVAEESGHPVLEGIPQSFSFTAERILPLIHAFAEEPVTLLMTDPSVGAAAVAVRELGQGRVVGFSHGGATALANENVQRLFVNAVDWAAVHPLRLQHVAPDPRATAVQTIDVSFLEPITAASFTRDDVTLTRNGGADLIDANVSVTRIDDTHYRIGGLGPLTDDLGQYRIVVNGNTISKASGGAVGEFAIDNWRRKAPPSVVDIVDVSPDPRETGVSSIDVTFSEPIQLPTFNRFDLRLTRDGGPNLITDAVTTSFVSGSTYRINNLDTLTQTPGTYRLVVSGNFTDTFNNTAASTASETWDNNLPPKLVLGGSTTFVENGRPQLLARGALVSDADDAVLAWGNLNVAITANAASGDRLRVQNQGIGAGQIGVTPDRIIRYAGVVIGRFSGGSGSDPLIVTLNDSASLPAVQALVRAVTFANFDSNPPTELRTVQFLLDDGDGGVSLPQFKYVNVQRNGGLPQISMGGEPSYRENSAPLIVSPFAGFSDPDSPNFDGGKLTVAIVQNASDDDRLAVQNQGTAAGEIGVAGSNVTFGGVTIGTLVRGFAAAPLEVSLNSSSTPAAVKALIRNISFATLGDRPSTDLRTLSFVMDDGDGGINSPVLKNVKVLAVNDAAGITADVGPVGYVNNSAGVLFAPTAAVLDPDSANFNGGQLTVSVIRGAVAANRLEIGGAFTLSSGNVLLGSTVIGRLTGSGIGFDSLVINFTNQATRSIVEQLVRSLKFRSVNAAHTFDRTIAITVLDTPHGFGSTALVNVAVSA